MVMSHMLGCCGGSRCIYGDVTYAGVLWGIEVYIIYGGVTYAGVLWGMEVCL